MNGVRTRTLEIQISFSSNFSIQQLSAILFFQSAILDSYFSIDLELKLVPCFNFYLENDPRAI